MFDAALQKDTASAKLLRPQLKHIALLGNFPPRRCGIATFTADLHAALRAADARLRCDVVAMNDGDNTYAYSGAVSVQIAQDSPSAYAEAADQLNRADIELVSLQHEFGIFGGAAGANLMTLTAGLRAPLVTTLHTVLEHPNAEQRDVMDRLIARSSRIVVMSKKGKEILTRVFNAPARKVAVIPHGAPDRPLRPSMEMKERFGFAGRDVIFTFGLLSPGKGIETAIRALPRIVASRPNALYVVVGATHPHLIAREGEVYRERMVALAEELGVRDNITFVNAFVDTELLLDYLTAADVYVTPYLNKAQITSGTLAYAVALGKPVVSTPYWHAEELLDGGCGVLTPFNDSDAIADAVTELLSDDKKRQAQSERAYARGRQTVWQRVGERYLQVFEQARAEWRETNATRIAPRGVPLPPISLRAVERLTDSTGMFQHSRLTVPDRSHGYCVDDNARALIFIERIAATGLPNIALERLSHIYASFIEHAWNADNKRFRNFMSFERAWLETAGSEDSFGRTLWAIGETAQRSNDPELKAWALHLGSRAVAHALDLHSPRTQAFCVLGLCGLARAGDDSARAAAYALARRLLEQFRSQSRIDWVWFEPVLGYDNARLPEALLRAGALFDSDEFRSAGLESLTWLTELHIAPSGRFRPVGSHSFGRPYAPPAQFDQQPLEAAAAVDAAWIAFDQTGDPQWRLEAYRAFNWFLGENDLTVRMADVERGGCYDGLGPEGPNRNQGAESVLSYQLALCAMRVRERPRRVVQSF